MSNTLKKTPLLNWLGFVYGYECKSKGVQLVKCDKHAADVIITQHHYSKKPVKNSFLSFEVYHFGEVKGAVQIGYGIRPKNKGGVNPDEVREFDRMWLSDDMPKFSETIVLSLLHHYLRSEHPEIKYLVSYSDTTVGNMGTIYKAANYRLEKEIKADFYILASGERVHPVSMYHRHNSRAWSLLQRLYPGIKKAEGKQLKFVFNL